MEKTSASDYGDRVASVYDELYPLSEQTPRAVALLRELADGGRVLELGVGTGRLALPLASSGLRVRGIDAAPAMLDRLRAKPGSQSIELMLGDFATADLDGRYQLIFIAFNTLFMLTTQEAQQQCFENVAHSLEPNGRFVVEAFVPDPARFERNQRVAVEDVGLDFVRLEVSMHDPAQQRVETAHVVVRESGCAFYPASIRYCWPSELDLMARIAGLELESRWADWQRRAFDAASERHVSVWVHSS